MTKKIRDPKVYYKKLIESGEIPNEHNALKIIMETTKNEMKTSEKEDTEMKT